MRCTTGRHSPPGREHASLSPNTSRSSTTADDCTRPSATERRSKHSPTTELWRPPQRDQPEDLSKILDTAQSAPFAGFGTGAEALTAWVETVLQEQRDVGEKLAAAGLGDAGHAFIWVSISSDVAIQTVLDGASTDLPTRSPVLPAGVTHVWVMSSLSSTRGLAWFPDTGWHEIAFRWSDEQPLQLTQPS